MPVTQDQITQIAANWITAWNHRDLETLLGMMLPNSRFATVNELLDPIVIDHYFLRGQNYVRAKFLQHIDILTRNQITFEDPYEIKVGEYYIDLRYRMTNGFYAHEILSLDEEGLIDQIYRNIDQFGIAF